MLVIIVIVLVVANLKGANAPPAMTISVWGTDPEETIKPFISAYSKVRPNVTVNYVQVDPTKYAQTVLNAQAAAQGPDVFMISDRSLATTWNRIVPVPAAQFNIGQLKQNFPQVVEQDLTDANGNIYGLPLYIDTLALLYNRDMFDQAAIVGPPKSWDELERYVPYFKNQDHTGQLVKMAAALGGSQKSVTHATDLLSLFMMQNGATMLEGDQKTFATGQAGLTGLTTYLKFSDQSDAAYTWNDSMPNSLDSFAQGNAAMVFGYHSDLEYIKNKSPFINMGVASMPQVAGAEAVNYAAYQALVVSSQSKYPAWAWDLVIQLTTNPNNAKMYMDVTKRPPALRTLIGANVNDPDLGVFARQALTARSWRMPDEARTNAILDESIRAVLSGQLSASMAIRGAAEKIQALLKQ